MLHAVGSLVNFFHLLKDGKSAFLARAVGHANLGDNETFVLIRNETSGNVLDGPADEDAGSDKRKERNSNDGGANQESHKTCVSFGDEGEGRIEAALKDVVLLALLVFAQDDAGESRAERE